MIPQRGEVWQVDLGYKGKIRPVLIVSRDDAAAPRILTTFVNITTQNRGSQYEVPLPHLNFLNDGSTVNTQGFGSGESKDKTLFLKRMGILQPDVMAQIERALRFALGMAD